MRALSGLMFFPRGGSAHVARSLARALPAHGWEVTVVSGSVPGHGDAAAFYAGLDVHPVRLGPGADAPMHPSYEDRPDAPDPAFGRVDDAAFEAHVDAWSRALEDAGAADCDVLHLHHLTPLHEAAARVAPGVPVVTHLHGTELLMLELVAEGRADWPHGEAWAVRMRAWAQASTRLLVLTEGQVARAVALLGVAPDDCVVCPNGFDPEAFDVLGGDRGTFWREQLVEHPRGWRPGGEEGSVAYQPADLAPMAAGGAPIAIAVGRFTAAKRLGLLVRAWARAQREERLPDGATLVLLGGHPGEWEGEHPLEAIAAAGAQRVLLAGWHAHDVLPSFLDASDVLVLASVREQFGSVLVEGMACGLPAVAVDRMGPAEVVRDGATGWLVEPDDEEALAAALAAALSDDVERRRRGRRAWRDARDRFSWPALAGRLAEVLDDAAPLKRSHRLADHEPEPR